jgi:hypothetical protein
MGISPSSYHMVPRTLAGRSASSSFAGPADEHDIKPDGCLYYAALRPSEAVALREADRHLPTLWGSRTRPLCLTWPFMRLARIR